MGEMLDLNNLFIMSDDGTMVPFNGIETMDISGDFDGDEEIPCNFLKTDQPYECFFDIGSKRTRKFLKALKKALNADLRKIRRGKRLKEKLRREALKNG